MTRQDDDRLQALFNERLTDIEAEVPAPGPWRRQAAPTGRQRPGNPLLSALRLGAAALVIAFFGGLVIAGVLSTPTQDVAPGTDGVTDASGTDELLSGFTLDELEPGVLRVVDDGVRDLAAIFDATESFDPVDIVAGLDGSVWRIGGGELIRLGHEATHAWPDDLPAHVRDEEFMVGPDGVLWLSVPDDRPSEYGPAHSLWAFDGTDWERQVVQGNVRARLDGVAMRADGSVYVVSANGVHRIDASGDTLVSPWRDHGADPRRPGGSDLAVTADGTRWLLSRDEMTVHRDDGSGWERLDVSWLGEDLLPSTFVFSDGSPVTTVIGPEETLWMRVRGTVGDQVYGMLVHGPLTSLGAEEPEWDAQSGGQDELHAPFGGGEFKAGAGSRAWFTPVDPESIQTCLGITELDGTVAYRYLDGLCVHTFDVAPDGTVWAVAGPVRDRAGEPVSTYAIRPEKARLRRTIEQPAAASAVELATEDVEPGVRRVLSDGHRDVSWTRSKPPVDDSADPKQFPDAESRVHVRPDGRVTVVLNSQFYELGQDRTYELPDRDFMTIDDEIAVDLEGTLYKRAGWRPRSWTTPGKRELWSFDGSGWSREDFVAGSVRRLATAPDGTVWADTTKGTLRKDPDGWTMVAEDEGVRGSTFVVTEDLTRWLIGPLARFFTDAGEGWQSLPAEWPEALSVGTNTSSVGPQGTLWVHASVNPAMGTPAVMARYQDGEWTTFDLPDDLPHAVGNGFSEHFEVGGDGSAWFNPGTGETGACSGLVNVDADRLERYLERLCIYDIDIGPDGRVWVTAGPPSEYDSTAGSLYVIDPR